MSDFEMVSTFQESFNAVINLLAIYFSIVFAFTVAGFLAAGKLNRTLATIAIGLFTIAAGFFALFIFVVLRNSVALAQVIIDAVAAGESSLRWLGFTNARNLSVVRPLLETLMFGLLACSYGGAVFFFLHQRRTTLAANR